MDLKTFKELLTPSGQELLQVAAALEPKETDFLVHYQSLVRRFPAELCRAALEISILRREALAKFPSAPQMYFSRPALEQASSHEISAYRAERFRPFPLMADLGCSVGSDTLAFAAITMVLGLDHDPLRLAMAAANLGALHLDTRTQLLRSDLNHPLPLKGGACALFFDPARRSHHHRLFSVKQYQPPLSILENWLPGCPALAVKISPGVDLDELAGYDAAIEFISLHGELKEAVLWFGEFNTFTRRATLLPGGHQLISHEGSSQPANKVLSQPQAFLYEPDPAVIRAGLVLQLAESLHASQLDEDIAYLTAKTCTATPFARTWRIEAWFPFQLKRLRAYLKENHVGRVAVKKRGSPIEPEYLIRQLRLHGDQERVVVLTHLRGEPIAMICLRV